MKKLIILAFLTCLFNHALPQEVNLSKIADSIESEGKMLYRSEFASWYGTDVFSDKCKVRLQNAGGYISYDTESGINNIFFSKDNKPVVLATISFGRDFDPINYKLDTVVRQLSDKEIDLYTIRQKALADVNKDTLFKVYKNTSLNLIPIVRNNAKRVYVITGPQVNGVVLFGNDYLFEFDLNNNIVSTKKLHKGLISVNSKKDSTQSVVASVHSHLPGYSQFITTTDVCTSMLYEKFTTWNQSIVVSKDYVSIWDCKKNILVILTMKAWEKMNPAKNALENNSH